MQGTAVDCDTIPLWRVDSVSTFIESLANLGEWEPVYPWFRGECGSFATPLTPMVFRLPRRDHPGGPRQRDGYHYDENNLLQSFRRRAHLMGLPIVPLRTETDKWLFLARHVGLPTRLLDWSGSALVGLYFALFEEEPVVWALNPHELNKKSAANSVPNAFPITWTGDSNIGFRNTAAAWELGTGALNLPVAIEPTNIHPRMNAQHSFFTVHGASKAPLCEQVGPSCLRRIAVQIADRDSAFSELRRLGVTESTVMPDAEALATELRRLHVVRN